MANTNLDKDTKFLAEMIQELKTMSGQNGNDIDNIKETPK